MKNTFKRIYRQLISILFRPVNRTPWNLLHHYPHLLPTRDILDQWCRSEWPQYRKWIDTRTVTTQDQWHALHREALAWKNFPKISIITPVYNTDAEILSTCILSVRLQTCPYWELILADDGSTRQETIKLLQSGMCADPRIHVLRSTSGTGTGISRTTNRGIDRASGDFILFLDHDDRLAPEAVQSVAAEIRKAPGTDILYSDRDMISIQDQRFMYLMKPAWSPETLYSGNYIFHLMCYRKQLLLDAGKLRPEFDGSQDYDLILRCMEHTSNIVHIPKVLYHWRQHDQSVAMNDHAKAYAFEAGKRALEDCLRRRRINADVVEDTSLQRGIYHVHLAVESPGKTEHITLAGEAAYSQYRKHVATQLHTSDADRPYLFVRHHNCREKTVQAPGIMAAWLARENIGLVSGCLLDGRENFVYAGMTYTPDGKLLRPYAGCPQKEAGYMAVTRTVRNISAPNPFCVAFRRRLWEELGGFDNRFHGPHALLDFALRALQSGWRILYVPQALFTCEDKIFDQNFVQEDTDYFIDKWYDYLLQGDLHYPRNISRYSSCYELDM
jgi:glycosyltransferase involved in cell wall biosynthesis